MASPRSTNKSVAIIDIGSNSVGLVIYRNAKSEPEIIYKKKVTCALARNLRHDKPKLDSKGMALALKTLRKFRHILDKRKPHKVVAIATAAMRAVASTKKGKAFHRKTEQALGHKIKIISGRREAKLAAHGIMMAVPNAVGICGDLGGGSLELASVNRGKIGHTATLVLGARVLAAESKNNPLKAEMIIHERLRHIVWLKEAKGKTFYLIGGSWRAIARVINWIPNHKLQSVDGFTIKASRARKYTVAIARQKPGVFRGMPKQIRDRADAIPAAASLLGELIERIQPKYVVFSAYGIREGLLRTM